MTHRNFDISRSKIALSAALGLVCALVFSSAALAHNPTGAFAPFKYCPLGNSSVEQCIIATTSSGEFVVGKKTVPITNPITLQGGTIENEAGEQTFVPAEGAATLSHSPQGVPGGLLGLVNCKKIENFLERIACELFFENEYTGVSATTELAAPASSIFINVNLLLAGFGPALILPVKVHLENPFLGSECYVGSNTKPIDLELTTGTSGKAKGNPGKLHILEGGSLIEITENSLVNNTFAAPAAEGCGGALSWIIDPILNEELGTPSAAGTNTAILNGTLKQAAAGAVKHSE